MSTAPIFGILAAAASPFQTVRARAKVLAREDREMRAELIRIRRVAGLTQADVAERMGVTPQAVQKFERYDADLKLSTLRRYVNAVGALVEHTVTIDAGQSLSLAEASDWEGRQFSVRVLPTPKNAHFAMVTESSWSPAAETRRTDFALAN